MWRKSSTVLICIVLFLCIASKSHAADYTTSYSSRYQIQKNGDSDVAIHIVITNNTATTYVSQFALQFPKMFSIENAKAVSDSGLVDLTVKNTDQFEKLTILLHNPAIGKNSVNTIDITFTQQKLFNVMGNVWEIVLPVLQDKNAMNNSVYIQFPNEQNKKITIAKPQPSHQSNTDIQWDNPTTKTLYVLFGDSQYYSLHLAYTLKNDRLTPGYYDIALPPETAYQKIYVESLVPVPDKTYVDSDGNYLARYTILPKKETRVIFTGYVSVFVNPQDNFDGITIKNVTDNWKDLTDAKAYWSLGSFTDLPEIKNATNPEAMYNYVTTKLTYDTDKISNDTKRLGANGVLQNPTTAICMEFTDLFIAMSRHAGIPTREIEGYGYNEDSQLRPLSLVSDILHAWPEYYDTTKRIWAPIDPTWGQTSGIDYFHSLDLNHIAFAIHGHDSTYPLPAGTYKTVNSKDVIVQLSSSIPQEKFGVEINQSLQNALYTNRNYTGTIDVTNTGNTYIINKVVKIKSAFITFNPSQLEVDMLAPLEKKTYKITYSAVDKTDVKNDMVKFVFNNKEIAEQFITITPFGKLLLRLEIGGIFVGIIVVCALFLIIKQRLV